jgi:hypothetical protein
MLIVILGLFQATVQYVYAVEIALEPTWMPEGNFSVLLYNPQRHELPIREEDSGITLTTYSYRTYFPGVDVSYEADFLDWTESKEYEIKKFGFIVTDSAAAIDSSVLGAKTTLEQQLQVPIHIVYSQEKAYKNYPGREVLFEFNVVGSGTKYRTWYRTCQIGYKEYWQFVTYPVRHEQIVRPKTFLDSFQLGSVTPSSEEKNAQLWDDEVYTWIADIASSLKKFLSTTPSLTRVERELMKLPNSKPYIKNGKYQGQMLLVNNKEFMFVFFGGYKDGEAYTANFALPPTKKENVSKNYDLFHRGLGNRFKETQKDTFDIGDGYLAEIHQYSEDNTISVQIAK